MKITFLNEIMASDFFNEITNNYTEDILDPYHGRIDWYLTNFYEKPVSEFEVDDYETKYYNKDLYNWRNESVINVAEMFYMFHELADSGDSKYIKIIWEDDTITFEASNKELKKYEEHVYYIVSTLVRKQLPNRKDLLSPTTNEVHIIKDEKGHTISVSHFEMNV